MLSANEAREITSELIDTETETKLTDLITKAANKSRRTVKVYNEFFFECKNKETDFPTIYITKAVINTLKRSGYEVECYEPQEDSGEFEYITISW